MIFVRAVARAWNFPLPLALLVSLEAACSGGASAPAPVASPSSLQAQVAALASPSVSASTMPLSDQMYEAQLLCTTGLNYHPCGLVLPSDTVGCFMLCQAQIAAGATNLMMRGVMECVARPPEPADAGSPFCDFQISEESPVDVVQLRASCNARCRELQSDGGAPAPVAPQP